MNATRLFLLAAALFGLPARATVADILHAQGFHDGPIFRERDDNADYIKVEINGHVLTLLIDTGAAETVLDSQAAKRAHVALGRDLGPVLGFNGYTDDHAHQALLSSFKIGGVELAPSPVRVATSQLGGDEDVDCDGLLGLLTLKANHAVFGYDPARFYFRPGPSREITGLDSFMLQHCFSRINLEVRHQQYFLPLTLNGATGEVVLDSGSFATLIAHDFAQRAHLQRQPFGILGSGINNRLFVAELIKPKSIAIGPLALPTISLAELGPELDATHEKEPEIEGFAGFDLIGRLYPLLDTVDDWLYVWPEHT
jgi:hypothetical protein